MPDALPSTTCLAAGATAASPSALITFAVYTLIVLSLAVISHRLIQRRKAFLGEYYLGSRNLGPWTFAFTFAATVASVGSFGGFPAKIYTHGWILALWIASYMVFPLTTMGLLGKRLNQVARKTGAITLPDLLRGRFNSPLIGVVVSALMLFFLSSYLIPQFKLASLMLKALLADVAFYQQAVAVVGQVTGPDSWFGDDPGYLLCLVVFALAVVFYTSFGGFRAVVWTDVLQGCVMLVGVVVLLVLTTRLAGGLDSATKELAAQSPPQIGEVELEWVGDPDEVKPLRAGRLIQHTTNDGQTKRLIRINVDAAFVKSDGRLTAKVKAVLINNEAYIAKTYPSVETLPDVRVTSTDFKPFASGAGEVGAYTSGPGPDPRPTQVDGFLPVGVAVSFFFMWAISGAGQPGNMVRLMAFNSTRTLRRGIVIVTLMLGVIYLSLVIIFCCARNLIPGWEANPDNAMPALCVFVADAVNQPWLAGLLVAAPFAAAMSTVDSFILMISSSVVRDLWQRNSKRPVSDKAVKRASYLVTAGIGVVVLLVAMNPPQFLQDVIVYAATGLAVCFLVPVALALYWPRANTFGTLAAIAGGFFAHLSLYVTNWVMFDAFSPYNLLGVSPIIWGLAASLIVGIAATLASPPPPREQVRRFFCA